MRLSFRKTFTLEILICVMNIKPEVIYILIIKINFRKVKTQIMLIAQETFSEYKTILFVGS